MLRTRKIGLFTAIALAMSLSPSVPAAQRHAGYAHALDDLRMARALLQRTNVAPKEDGSQDEVSLTITNIDAAIAEISKESAPNGKDSQEAPRIDARTPWAKRLSMSFKFLDRAIMECSREKDDSGDAGLQARVMSRLDHAHDRLRVAIDTVNFDYSARNLPTRND